MTPVVAVLWVISLVVAAAACVLLTSRIKRTQKALDRAVQQRYNVLEAVPNGLYIVDSEDRFTHVNEAAEELLRVESGSIVGRNVEAILDPFASELLPAIRLARKSGEPLKDVRHSVAANRWIEFSIMPAGFETLVTLRDITSRERAELKVRANESRLRLITQHIPAVLWTVDRRGIITSLSGAGLAALDLSEDAIGRPLGDVLEGITSMTAALFGSSVQFEAAHGMRWLRHHAEPLPDERGTVVGAVGVALDITEIRETQRQLVDAARRDVLTGLPNRFALEEELRERIAAMRPDKVGPGVLFIDLNRFKMINDSLGHAVGDRVLRVAAHRLRNGIGQNDMLARPGGDEFIVVLDDIRKPADAGAVAHRLLRMFNDPIVIDDRELHVSMSIGASIAPADGTNPDALIRAADLAMYRAKASRRGFVLYEDTMVAASIEQLRIESQLHHAVERGEFMLAYQPIVDAITRRIVSCEALVRWRHPEHGLKQPDEFLELAEDCGLMTEISRWVMREACRAAVILRGIYPDFCISVNLSSRDLAEADLPDAVKRLLAEHGLPPSAVEFEVSEQALLNDRAIAVLRALRSMGTSIAVDDFGVAYSALSHVKRLPISTIKIDRSFLHDIETEQADRAIVRAILALSTSLGVRTVAEGVETNAQWNVLKEMGCERVQGFAVSEAVDLAQFTRLLTRGSSQAALRAL